MSEGIDGDSDDVSEAPSISAGGRFGAFASQATNLVGKDENKVEDVFVRDRGAAATR